MGFVSPRRGDEKRDDKSGLAPDMLAARLGAWLCGRLGGRVGGALHRLLSDWEGELVGEGDVEVVVERETWVTTRGARPFWPWPDSRGWEEEV